MTQYLQTKSEKLSAGRMKLNIASGLIRISVGLEYTDDILNDILQALEKC